MKNKEIEEILFDMDLIVNHNKVPIYFTQNKVKLLLSYIEQLENEIEQFKTRIKTQKRKRKKATHKKNIYKEKIEQLEKRNKELYEGFMATQEELTDYATKNEQLENKCESLLKNKNETLRYISNYLALDQRYKWNDNVDEKLKLVKKFLNGREKTIAGISYEDLLRQNKQLENNRDKAIEVIDLITPELWNISNAMTYKLKDIKYILKGDSDES